MNTYPNHQLSSPSESELIRVLACRYGDGTVYLPRGTPRRLLLVCQELDFINTDGFITRAGRELVARSCP
jgi:hypothetical protein